MVGQGSIPKKKTKNKIYVKLYFIIVNLKFDKYDLKLCKLIKNPQKKFGFGLPSLFFSSGTVSAEDLDFCLLGIDAVHER